MDQNGPAPSMKQGKILVEGTSHEQGEALTTMPGPCLTPLREDAPPTVSLDTPVTYLGIYVTEGLRAVAPHSTTQVNMELREQK